MATEPRGNHALTFETIPGRTVRFAGEPPDVTGARLAADEFLRDLARASPPTEPECRDDILLIVAELASNAVQYAPGPFELRLRPTFDGVHVTLHDTSSALPSPRPFRPDSAGGGIGWYLIHTLCRQVSVVRTADGKDVHVFLPW
ncbi:ATP-binding protein [Streptomyces sp. NBC_01275]|uniref:ATP-binding protein n=1 Tax=Streptomyces sp. NBC_01275 TaxID=2903807 RepID=UPI0022542F97|nr:ATP-binding protein [Streptomyces sp. NBC_01275]MCX4767577.1 ATP-binding protein [Streptomyces sp. NBC_01275]